MVADECARARSEPLHSERDSSTRGAGMSNTDWVGGRIGHRAAVGDPPPLDAGSGPSPVTPGHE
jgi:hypothetical protein